MTNKKNLRSAHSTPQNPCWEPVLAASPRITFLVLGRRISRSLDSVVLLSAQLHHFYIGKPHNEHTKRKHFFGCHAAVKTL